MYELYRHLLTDKTGNRRGSAMCEGWSETISLTRQKASGYGTKGREHTELCVRTVSARLAEI